MSIAVQRQPISCIFRGVQKMDHDEKGHTKGYNALKERLQEMRMKAVGDVAWQTLIGRAEAQADALEHTYIQDMRTASAELGKNANDFRKFAEQFTKIQAELEALRQQPHGFGTYVRQIGYEEIEDQLGNKHKYPLVDIYDDRGRPGEVLIVNDEIKPENLKFGQKLVLLNTAGPAHVLKARNEFDTSGRNATVAEILTSDQYGMRLMVSSGDIGEQHVCWLSASVAENDVHVGSRILVDTTGQFVIEILPEQESAQYLLTSETSNIRFDRVGGLDSIIADIQKDFAWPLLYPSVFQTINLSCSKGLLLYGPPGVGKTLIAKALVNFMADQIEKVTGKKAIGHFYNIKGPELLNKFVGETEGKIRNIFDEAKKRASPLTPVIIYFDEMDAMFGQRGSGISSDVNLQHVTQLCAMMDGLEARGNVIVVGSSNRAELIDSAVLRPGRMDKKILVPRPDAKATHQIFLKYLEPIWGPINPRYDVDVYIPVSGETGKAKGNKEHFGRDPQKVQDYLIKRAVQRMYDKDDRKNLFVEVHFDGQTKPETLRYGDFASGAAIESIVKRAKMFAVSDHIEQKTLLGVEMKHLFLAIEAVFAEERPPRSGLGDITNWLNIHGKLKGPLVAFPKFIDHDPAADVDKF